MGSLPPRPAPLFLGARGLWVPQLSAWLLCTDAGAALLGVTHKPVRVGAGPRPVFSPTFPTAQRRPLSRLLGAQSQFLLCPLLWSRVLAPSPPAWGWTSGRGPQTEKPREAVVHKTSLHCTASGTAALPRQAAGHRW